MLEDVEALHEMFNSYFWRLQFNTVCNLLVNVITIYLILRHSTAEMGNYRYYILFTVLSALIMDFHISCFFGLYVLFPAPIVCATGITRYSNYYFGSIFQYVSP